MFASHWVKKAPFHGWWGTAKMAQRLLKCEESLGKNKQWSTAGTMGRIGRRKDCQGRSRLVLMVACQEDHHDAHVRLDRVYPDSSSEEEVQIYEGLPWPHTKQEPESKSVCFLAEHQPYCLLSVSSKHQLYSYLRAFACAISTTAAEHSSSSTHTLCLNFFNSGTTSSRIWAPKPNPLLNILKPTILLL